MSKHTSADQENSKRQKHKAPKFRDYYDEAFNEEDEKEIQKRKKKLGKKPKRKKSHDPDWSGKE